MSSRNVYLSPKERAVAPVLYRELETASRRIRDGGSIGPVMDEAREAVAAAGFSIDYLEARHAETLARIAHPNDGPIRLLVAARIGATRLIDNIAV